MKKIIAALVSIIPFTIAGQIEPPEIYLDLGVYYEDEFEPSPNIYGSVSAGIELFSYKFLAPEIEISYYGGGDSSDSFNTDLATGIITGWSFNNSMNVSVWAFAPKLFYGERNSRLVLIPKYNIANIRAKGVYSEINKKGIVKYARAKAYYWSCSLGFEIDGWSERIRMGLYINYSGLDAGVALNKIQFTEREISAPNYNTKTLGGSFRIFYNFNPK